MNVSDASRYKAPILVIAALIIVWGVFGLIDVPNYSYNGYVTDGNNTITRVNAGGPAESEWPAAVVEDALGIHYPDPETGIDRYYYGHENHVVNALETSGLSKDEDPDVLLDWLSGHARERISEKFAEAANGEQGELFTEEE